MLSTRKITRVNLRSGRFYQVEGFDEIFPSVTTVLDVIAKPALIPWARDAALGSVREALTERIGGMAWLTPEWVDEVIEEGRRRPEKVKTEAGDFGTQAHILIDAVLKGEKPQIPPEMDPLMASFDGWRRAAGFHVRATEHMVYSAKYKYAGTLDALAYRGDRMVALDWKTSKGLYPEYALQVAAYAKALEEMSGEVVHEAWVVRLDRRTLEVEVRQVQDMDKAFIAFRAALYLWRAIQGKPGLI